MNERDGIKVKDPKTEEERTAVASDCVKGLKLTIPMLIDDMKDTARKAYGAWPDRLYVIGKDGKVAFQGKPGPWGFKPGEAETALKAVLGK